MEISTVRDFVISILGSLCIILTIGVIVGLIILYTKLRKLLKSMNKYLTTVRKWLAYVHGLFRGLNEAISMFSKGGGR